jgi:hypothetical protein
VSFGAIPFKNSKVAVVISQQREKIEIESKRNNQAYAISTTVFIELERRK